MWIDKAVWYCLSFLLFTGIIYFTFKNKKKKKKIIIFLTIFYFVVGIFLAGAYIYTHTPINDIVPPIIYIRLLDADGNPVKNATCNADIWTEKGYTEDKLLQERSVFSELACYGRTRCPNKDYWGYYKLSVTGYSYEKIFWIFHKPKGIVKGDFEINIVCKKDDSVAHYEMNQNDFPCSPLPLLGSYVTPSFYCSSKDKLIDKTIYDLDEETFDEYDTKAINFINKNYPGQRVLANDKLSIIIYNQKINKVIGIIPDKESYGQPYMFNEFMVASCERRLRLVKENNIDLVLSRFELPPNYVGTQKYNKTNCSFMKEIYSNKDYIYEITV